MTNRPLPVIYDFFDESEDKNTFDKHVILDNHINKPIANPNNMLSSSSMSAYQKSPADFLSFERTEGNILQGDMLIGDLIDCRVTNPDRYQRNYYIGPELPAKSTKGFLLIMGMLSHYKSAKAKGTVNSSAEYFGNMILLAEGYEHAYKASGYLKEGDAKKAYEQYASCLKQLMDNEGKSPITVEESNIVDEMQGLLRKECPYLEVYGLDFTTMTEKKVRDSISTKNSFQLYIQLCVDTLGSAGALQVSGHIDHLAYVKEENKIVIIDYKWCGQMSRILSQWDVRRTWYQLSMYRFLVTEYLEKKARQLGLQYSDFRIPTIECYAYYVTNNPMGAVVPVKLGDDYYNRFIEFFFRDLTDIELIIKHNKPQFPEVIKNGYIQPKLKYVSEDITYLLEAVPE